MSARTATAMSPGHLALTAVSGFAALLTANYLLPGAVLPTTPRALYTTAAATAAVVLAAEIGVFYLQLTIARRLFRSFNRALAVGDEDAAERTWWTLYLTPWTIALAYALAVIPALMMLVSLLADRLGWPTTLRGPVDAGITGIIVVLCAKVAYATAGAESRRAALFGLWSVAAAWGGFLLALETVEGMRLAARDQRELPLVAAVAAGAFFAVPKRRWRMRTMARDMRASVAAYGEFGLGALPYIAPVLTLIVQYLGAVLLLWVATWHLWHLPPAPLSFASAAALFAAAGWVTLARLPVVVAAWFWGPPKESDD